LNKIPPHSIELEQSILASCLLYATEYTELIEGLVPQDFYKGIHQKIFKAITDLYATDNPVDLVSVRTQNVEIPATYLTELSDAPVVTDSEFSKQTLRGYSALRRLIEIGNAAMKRGFEGKPADIADHIDFIQRESLKMGNGFMKKSFRHISSIIEEVVDRCESLSKTGGLTGIPSGFKDLDSYTCGFQSGDLIIIAGRPSMGKTAFCTTCIKNASECGHHSAFFSLEMPGWQIGNRLLSTKAQIESLKVRSGKFSREDWIRLHDAAAEIYKWKLHVDDSSNLHYRDIIQRGRTIKKQEGADIFWIDYLSFLQGDKEAGTVKEVESVTRAMKGLAKELKIPVVLLCQLNRKCEERPNKRPILSDLRDSGAIEQDADVVLFLYRHAKYVKKYNDDGGLTAEYEKYRHVAELNIAKQRNGPTESIGLYWNESTTTFGDLMR